MKKQFAAVGAVIMALTLTTCSTSANAQVNNNFKYETAKVVKTPDFFQNLAVINNTARMDKVVIKLKKYANKTWYVFSGNTPNGWDCSGLVMWTYRQLGIELKHSASVQKNSGRFVSASHAKPGDIVAFGWRGWSGAGHVGIYLGNGMMINAPSPGHKTTIQSVNSFAKYGYSKVTFTRILKTN